MKIDVGRFTSSNQYCGSLVLSVDKCDSDQSAAKALLAGAANAANGYKSVQGQLRELGIVMSKRGEALRINYFGGLEDTACYPRTLQEALDQGFELSKRRP
jgi:hypothetical protein